MFTVRVKYIKQILLLLIIVIIAQPIRSQGTDYVPKNPTEGMSPEASSIKRYGDIPVSLYTGTPNISIPIATLHDGQIAAPIELSYHSAGIKPDEHPSWVGLGWTLNVGGVITREMRGWCDEDKRNNMGYYYCCKSLCVDKYSAKDAEDIVYNQSTSSIAALDCEADKFNFSFNNYTGFFMLNSKGEWQVYCDKPIKVEVGIVTCGKIAMPTDNGQSPIELSPNTYYFSSFTLTTDDGTQYIFGQQPYHTDANPAIELSIDCRSQQTSIFEANAWYLVEIKKLNGDNVKFEYERGDYVLNISNSKFDAWMEDLPFQIYSRQYNGRLVSPVYLSKISSNNFNVRFHSSQSVELDYSNSDYLRQKPQVNIDLVVGTEPIYLVNLENNVKWRKLDALSIYDANHDISQRIDFNMSNSVSQRLTLNGITIKKRDNNDFENYQFEYNDIEKLPKYLSNDINLWGYYGSLSNDEYTPNYKQCNPEKSGIGVLSKIKYPTGGTTIFEFEPHTYTMYVDRMCNLKEANTPQYAGGIRIKRIINIPADGGKPEYKEYIYHNGILEGEAIFQSIQNVTFKNGYSTTLTTKSTFPLTDVTNNFGNHIGYPNVTERLADNSYIEHHFKSQIDSLFRDKQPIISNNAPLLTPRIIKSHYRGREYKTEFFSKDNTLKKRITINYTPLNNNYTQGLNFYHVYDNKIDLINFSLYQNLMYPLVELSRSEDVFETSHHASNKITAHKRYNKIGQIVSDSIVTYVGGQNRVDVTRYNYLWSANDWYAINHVYNTLSVVSIFKNNKQKSHLHFTYALKQGIDITKEFPILESVVDTFDGSDYKQLYQCVLSDNRGLPINIIDENALSTIFLWDKHRLMPIAEIRNTSVEEIKAVLGYEIETAYRDDGLENKLISIRSLLPHALITTYTYRPETGVTSIKDPSGKIIYYDYDNQDRLATVKDFFGNPLMKYFYNTYSGASTGNLSTPSLYSPSN